jgi:hypothetical protein
VFAVVDVRYLGTGSARAGLVAAADPPFNVIAQSKTAMTATAVARRVLAARAAAAAGGVRWRDGPGPLPSEFRCHAVEPT